MFEKPNVERFFQMFGQNVSDQLFYDLQPTKAKLVMESLILFAEKGYEAVSVRDLADRVNLQTSSIYNHFKSKQELLDYVLMQSEDLYYLYLTQIKEQAAKSTSLAGALDVIIQNPKNVLNITSCFAFSLVHCEKYRDMATAAIFTSAFVTYSIDFYAKIMQGYVDKGLAYPFDVKTAAIIINNSFHTVVSLLMQEYLGLQPVQDLSDLFLGLKDFILKQAFPSNVDHGQLPEMERLPPYPKEMMVMDSLVDEESPKAIETLLAEISPSVSLDFSNRAESYLKAIETECALLTEFKLGSKGSKIFKSFTDSYFKSVATSNMTGIEQVLEAKDLIESQAEKWRTIRMTIQKKVRDAELKLKDIIGVILKVEEESNRAFRRQVYSCHKEESASEESVQTQVAVDSVMSKPMDKKAELRQNEQKQGQKENFKRKHQGNGGKYKANDLKNIEVKFRVNGRVVDRPKTLIEPCLAVNQMSTDVAPPDCEVNQPLDLAKV
jgi:AcrR family transcriptional regulator